ncbi:methyltransferase domain-containing protein [Trichoderma breve]|uniref:tRNA N(3)-methylcytidine methyltransferase n=1 Tax=Trichoderma breve TaxID=2034170 RepID=A0A9W9BB59_9HYPO|nr:methyltransferase domain-containing protein [Trichoderma breve]KAJ4856346.1 methyltransferase domain-containing protein [Trichoderma breve]
MIDPEAGSAAATATASGLEDMATLKAAAEAVEAAEAQTDKPSHRSHDPAKNLKRSDPFQFGSRYLEAGDDVFEFNAWDHVETDDAYKLYAEGQLEKQRQSPVSDFDKTRFNTNPAMWWNKFYKNNTANFFKDRKWLQQEFPILADVTKEDAGPQLILEIGAGAGNTAFPVLANNKNPLLKIHACDFSKQAVEVMRKSESYDPKHIQADVWDVAGETLPPDLEEGTVDLAIMIFVFSALSPREWAQAGRYLEENFYIRGDGTRVYFFDQDELAGIWSGPDAGENSEEPGVPRFTIEKLGVDRRLLVNRAEKIKMYRCWLQGRFRKK